MFRKTHLDLLECSSLATKLESKQFISHQRNCVEGTSSFGEEKRQQLSLEKQAHLQGPLIAQLAGHNVKSVLEAAALVMDDSEGKLTGIDLNLGCPQNIAKKGNYGAFLMEQDLETVCEILTALSSWMEQHYPATMVSAKIRLPLTDEELVHERIPRLIDTGISFLTVHGRTIHENKTKVKGCHMDRIKLAVETAQRIRPGFPVVANGGIETYADTVQVQQDTGAVAVMSSEALLETPNVFSPNFELTRRTARQRLEQQLGFAKDYLEWCTVCPPLPGVLGNNGSANIVRSHLFKFLHRYLQEYPDMRERLADNDVCTIQKLQEFVDELESRYSHFSDEALEACSSSQPKSSWYRRHRESMEKGLVHTRQFGGATSASIVVPSMTMEEKKALLRKRISKLQDQKRLAMKD